MTRSKSTYKGRLARRSNDLPPAPPSDGLLGPPSAEATRTYKRERDAWVERQIGRMFDDGFPLLFEHYGLEQGDFEGLALRLARAHVPFFMDPAPPRGRPRRHDMAFIDKTIAIAKGKPHTQQELIDQIATGLEISSETLLRELRRYRKIAGKNKK